MQDKLEMTTGLWLAFGLSLGILIFILTIVAIIVTEIIQSRTKKKRQEES